MKHLTDDEVARAKDPRAQVYKPQSKSHSTPPGMFGAHTVLLDAEYVFVDRASYERVCERCGVEPH